MYYSGRASPACLPRIKNFKHMKWKNMRMYKPCKIFTRFGPAQLVGLNCENFDRCCEVLNLSMFRHLNDQCQPVQVAGEPAGLLMVSPGVKFWFDLIFTGWGGHGECEEALRWQWGCCHGKENQTKVEFSQGPTGCCSEGILCISLCLKAMPAPN